MPLDVPDAGSIVYDPRGVVDVDPVPLGRRAPQLNGMRLGVLSNRKWNGNKLLRHIVSALKSDIEFSAVTFYEKESFSKNADPGLLGTIIADNDLVLTAIGD
jgi:hypothetical protein